MKRILMMVIRNILIVPFYWFKLVYYSKHVDKYTLEEHFDLLRFIDGRAVKGGNVKVEGYGMENLPKENGYMIYPNHQGMFDVLAIIQVFPSTFGMVFKQELANIPFLKQIIACTKSYQLDREDPRQGLKVIQNVSKDVSEGKNFLIFAEGTRSKKGNHVGEFKGGSFKAATKAKCPIVPVALIDAFRPFDTNTISQVTVQVHFLEPISYEEYKDMKTNDIAAMVQERIQNVINENIR